MLLWFWFILCNSFLSSPEKMLYRDTDSLSQKRYIDFLMWRTVSFFLITESGIIVPTLASGCNFARQTGFLLWLHARVSEHKMSWKQRIKTWSNRQFHLRPFPAKYICVHAGVFIYRAHVHTQEGDCSNFRLCVSADAHTEEKWGE